MRIFSKYTSRLLLYAAAAGFLALLCSLAYAQYAPQYWGKPGGRSYYGYRNSHFYYGPYWGKGKTYYTYYYYFKTNPSATKYSYHTVFYYPKGKYDGYYYKNKMRGHPDYNKFWGRCRPGSSEYELLPPTKRKANLEDIEERDFENQHKMVMVPGMKPGETIVPPPQPTIPPEE
jgi:hypothetical protein